jgi:hypothetical protein
MAISHASSVGLGFSLRTHRVAAPLNPVSPTAPAPLASDDQANMNRLDTTPDAQWLAEWIDFGLRELEQYLGKHRCFDDYYAERECSRDNSRCG